MPVSLGSHVDRYEVVARLGSGGMADVWVIEHRTLGTRRALKVLRHSGAANAERLRREGRAQAELQHPNIVRVLDLVEVDGEPGLVLELVEGPTLDAVVREGPLSLERVERYVRHLVDGLAAAHDAGFVHRDLKPGNVLVDHGDLARLTDFGLVGLLDSPDARLTRAGATLGTPAYMAPEQFEQAARVDARADVWALGVLVYELLTGLTPAEGLPVVAGWQRMSERSWRPVRQARPEVPERMERAVAWALEPVLDRRCPSVRDFWSAFVGEANPRSQVTWWHDAEPTQARSRRTTGAAPSRVRVLIGRDAELERAWDRLDARGGLVTLVGPGGVGKTRLAAELADRFATGGRPTVWVDLEPARTVDDVVHRVGFVVGDVGDGSPAAVGRRLARHPMLLVLDNLEQLPRELGRQLGDWLRAAPSLRLLATSQHATGTPEETAIELAPLALPDGDDARKSEAWILLVQAAPPGSLEGVDPALARRLLEALEGLPLAIELAAARLEILEPKELVERLSRRLDVLADPDASGTRHGALRDTIAWSWSLLQDEEKSALVRLAVFRGPFRLSGAERILGARALDAVHALVRRHLLRRSRARFSFLTSIREFAEGRSTAEERASATLAHAAWVAEAAGEVLVASRRGDLDALRTLEELAPEVWAVVERAATDDRLRAPALAAADGLTTLYRLRGPQSTLLALADAALALLAAHPESRAAEGGFRLVRAFALRRTGRVDQGLAELRRALAEPAHSGAMRALLLSHLADLHLENGGADAAPLYEQALELAELHGPPHLCRTVPAALATMARDRAAAEAWWARSEAAADPDDPTSELTARKQWAWLLLSWNELDRARDAYLEVREIARALGDQRSLGYVDGQLGLIAEQRGELPEALERLDRVVARMRDEADPSYLAWYLVFRARVLGRLDRWTEAHRDATEAERSASGPDLPDSARSLLGVIAARLGRTVPPTCATPLASAITEARTAFEAGDRAATAAAVARARTAVTVLDHDLGALVDHALAPYAAETWRVADDGAWFEAPDGGRVDVSKHAANARLLRHLLERRLAEPGAVSSAAELAAVGWPGERIVPNAAGNRVRVALSTLRQLGLDALVERDRGGWRLRADAVVRSS